MEAPELPEPHGLFPNPASLPVPVLGFQTLTLPEDDVSGGGRGAGGRDPPGDTAMSRVSRHASPGPVSPQGSGAEELLGLTVNPDIACGLGTGPEPPQPEGPPPVLLEVVCDLSTPLDPLLFPGIQLAPHPDPQPTVSPCTPSSPSDPPVPPQFTPVPPGRAAPADGGGEAAAGTGGGDPARGPAPHPGTGKGDTGGSVGPGGRGTAVTPLCPRPRSGS